MGVHVRQRPDRPGWWVFINHNKKQKKKYFPDKETAAQFARKIREGLALASFGLAKEEPERKPFRAYYRTWLDTYVKSHTKLATYTSYELAYRAHLLPLLGETDIRNITREQLKRFLYDKLNAGPQRLLRATEGLVSGAYQVRVIRCNEDVVSGFVRNGDGIEYGVELTTARSFCSCNDSMFRHRACKHAVALALYTIRNPQVEEKKEEARPYNLNLVKTRKGFAFSA